MCHWLPAARKRLRPITINTESDNALHPFHGAIRSPLSRVVVVDIDAQAACDSGDTW